MENPNMFLLNTQEHGGISIAILVYWSDESFFGTPQFLRHMIFQQFVL